MKSVHPEHFGFPAGAVVDGGPIYALMFPNHGHYFNQIFPVAFDFWGPDSPDNIRNINPHGRQFT